MRGKNNVAQPGGPIEGWCMLGLLQEWPGVDGRCCTSKSESNDVPDVNTCLYYRRTTPRGMEVMMCNAIYHCCYWHRCSCKLLGQVNKSKWKYQCNGLPDTHPEEWKWRAASQLPKAIHLLGVQAACYLADVGFSSSEGLLFTEI